MMARGILPETRKLLALIGERQPMPTHDVFRATRSGGAGDSEQKLSMRLTKLCGRGLLINDGNQRQGLWRLTTLGRNALSKQAADSSSACAAAPTPPRQVYVMHGPVYQPAPAAHHRAGAFDFMACPSIELGKAVAYQPEVRRG